MNRPPPGSPHDSTHDILGDWDPFPAGEASGADSLFAPPPRRAAAPEKSKRPVEPDPVEAFSTQDDPCLDFALPSHEGPAGLGDSLLGTPGAAIAPRSLRSRLLPTSQSPHPSGARAAPKRGEEIGGFRIVTELGRGAFARVYLAEQIELGDRLVALKVSKAEGEEPQLLAKLQHTHIVPIHSVHDDPETGLRLLCMPYLGGANLAQVLEALGESTADGKGGRGIVAALDEVSQRYQSQTRPGLSGARPDSLFGGARASAVQAAPASVIGTGLSVRNSKRKGDFSRSIFPASLNRGSLERLQNLWDRFTSRRDAAQCPAQSLDDREFDQPARQFLREANSIETAVWIVARLAEGLEHAHSRGLLHRDLKPSNILIAGDGTPMLLDFNLSTIARAAHDESERALLGGTLPYMAPEHLDAFSPNGTTPPEAVDERADIYALGIILFEILAGRHPFPEPANRSLLDTLQILADMRRKPPSLRAENARVPWSLDAIVAKCLAHDPAQRFARARHLADDLNRFLDDLPMKHTREPSPRETIAKWARRNPRLCGNSSIAGCAALLILSLGGLIGMFHGNMLNLAARLKLQTFRENLNECRFLLNVTGGPAEHLERGLARAEKTLDAQRVDRDGSWRADSWVRRLTAAEQSAVAAQTAELILAASRVKSEMASRSGTRKDKAEALQWSLQWLDRAESLDPDPPAALYHERARIHESIGRADLATGDRARAAAKAPTTARDVTVLGGALLARGALPQAEAALRRAVDLDPKSFWAWFSLGHCHFEQNRPLDAAGDFAVCTVLEPRFAWPRLNRGLALARAGRLIEAREAYTRALTLNPRFAEAWLNRGLADLELDDLAAAEAALSEALKLGGSERSGSACGLGRGEGPTRPSRRGRGVVPNAAPQTSRRPGLAHRARRLPPCDRPCRRRSRSPPRPGDPTAQRPRSLRPGALPPTKRTQRRSRRGRGRAPRRLRFSGRPSAPRLAPRSRRRPRRCRRCGSPDPDSLATSSLQRSLRTQPPRQDRRG